jgi:hypothetical protein
MRKPLSIFSKKDNLGFAHITLFGNIVKLPGIRDSLQNV